MSARDGVHLDLRGQPVLFRLDIGEGFARIVRPSSGRSSVVERLLAKEKVVSSNLIARSGRAEAGHVEDHRFSAAGARLVFLRGPVRLHATLAQW